MPLPNIEYATTAEIDVLCQGNIPQSWDDQLIKKFQPNDIVRICQRLDGLDASLLNEAAKANISFKLEQIRSGIQERFGARLNQALNLQLSQMIIKFSPEINAEEKPRLR